MDGFQIALSALLLVAVHGAPIIARKLLGACCAWPLDFSLRLADGQPLLGHSKTWRGVAAALLAGLLLAPLTGLTPGEGLQFAAWAMLGDAGSSFIKRRLGLAPSARFRGLDQWPESLLPLWMLRQPLELDAFGVLLVIALFTLFEWWVSPWLYRLHIRKRPW